MSDPVDMNRALIVLSESSAARFWKDPYASLSRPEQVFLAVWELEAEVNNGSFHQYFGNSSGDNASQVVGALQEIRAMEMASIVQRAVSVFGTSAPAPNQGARLEQLDATSPRFQ